jgi:hypothetical protein
MPHSCPVDEHEVGIGISEDFQNMRRQWRAKLSILQGEYQRRANLGDRQQTAPSSGASLFAL